MIYFLLGVLLGVPIGGALVIGIALSRKLPPAYGRLRDDWW